MIGSPATPGDVSAESSYISNASSYRSERSLRLPIRDPRHTRRRKLNRHQDFFLNPSRTALTAAPTDLVSNREILYPIITAPRPVTAPHPPERPSVDWHSRIWQHTAAEELQSNQQEEENPNLVIPPPAIPLIRTQSMCPLLHRVPSWQVPDLDGAPLWLKFVDDTEVTETERMLSLEA